MNRRILVSFCLLPTVLLPAVTVIGAQQQKKVARIGYLSGADPANDTDRSEPFRTALRDLGYIEGQNIIIEYRYAENRRGRQSQLAGELVRLKVDLIVVAGGDNWIRAAKKATKTIPIIMTGGGSDPVHAGFVASLDRPGGNVTGVTNLSRELGGKRLELLKETVPKLARVAVLYDPAVPGTTREVTEDLPIAARALGVTVQPWEVPDRNSFERVFSALNNERLDGLYVPGGGPIIRANLERIARFALMSQLPSMFTYKQVIEAGGLIYYGVDRADGHRRAATYVDKILKGAKPANLPVEQPTKFELIVNLKTAKQIGLTIPREVLYRADKVIK